MGWTALLLITSRLPIHKRFNSVQPLQHPLLRSCWKRRAVNFSDRPSSMSFLERQQLLQQEVWAPPQRLHFQSEKPESQRTETILREQSSFIRPWLQVSLSISAVFLHCTCQGLTWAETESEKMRMLLLWQCIITFIFILRVCAFVNSCFFSVS